MIGQYQYMKEPYEEENDINTGLDHNGLAKGFHFIFLLSQYFLLNFFS